MLLQHIQGDHVLMRVPLNPTGAGSDDSVTHHHVDTSITATKIGMTYEVVKKLILHERCALQHYQLQESTNTCHFIIANNK